MDRSAYEHSKVRIRRAQKSESGMILEFIKELAGFERLLHEVEATEKMIEENVFEKQHAEVVFAELDGHAVGFALYFHNFSTFVGKPGLYLEDLYVKPEHRGKGIGKALLIHLAKLARERGCGRFEWAVLNWNEKAISFYKSLGAKPMEDWKVFRLDGQQLDTVAALAGS